MNLLLSFYCANRDQVYTVNLNEVPKSEVTPSRVSRCMLKGERCPLVLMVFLKSLLWQGIQMFLSGLLWQKLTWRSKQQDRENCAMKGKHKVSLAHDRKTTLVFIIYMEFVINISYSLFRMNAITSLKSLFQEMMRWCLSVEQMHLTLCADTIG